MASFQPAQPHGEREPTIVSHDRTTEYVHQLIEMAETSDKIDPLSRPSMKKLCQYVVNKAASKWDILGYALLDENQSAKIDTIKSNFQDSEKCCVEMFNYWLTTHPNANWHDLVTALNTANLQLIATDLEKMFIEHTPPSQVGVSEAHGLVPSTSNGASIMSQQPVMGDLKKIVIPEVKAHWEDLAYSMKYTIPQVTAIEKDRDLKDLDDRCTKLFKDWLTTNNGCKPKTWQTLLERIEYVNELYAAAERIKKTLGVK